MTNVSRNDVSTFERVLFGLTRFFALAVGVAGLAGITVCALFLVGRFGSPPTAISYTEVMSAREQQHFDETGKLRPIEEPLKYDLPANLTQYFGRDNLGHDNKVALEAWLHTLDTEEQRGDFLDNMSLVVADAEAQHNPTQVI